jgi:CheY-like chemotaxis protein
MSKVNILIAEDDRDDYELLKEAIHHVLPKFNVQRAEHGEELLKAINEKAEPDVIFLDLNIPRKNGFDCLIELRQKEWLSSTPIVIYSTSAHFEDIDRCYKSGCTLYLVKPTSFKEMVIQVKQVFHRLGLPKAELRVKERFVVKKEQA